MKSSVKIIKSVFLVISMVSFNTILNAQGIVRVDRLNYSNQEEVLLFEKFEIGILPGAGNNAKINRFVNESSGSKLNPYLEWEIKVTAEFHHKESDSVILVDGFYYQNFSSFMKKPLPKPFNRKCYSDVEYRSLGGYKKKQTDYPFLVRFAPVMLGEWEYRVHVVTASDSIVSGYYDMTVVMNENDGYTKVAKNNRFLQRGDSSFVPIGCNVPWPLTSYRFDPEFASLNHVKEGITLEEQYRGEYVKPRLYETYRGILKGIADGGANSFRLIMYPSGTDIEWEELGNYTDRLAMAQELDSILMTAEQNGLYIHWNMQIHYSFQVSEHAYYTRWAWDQEIKGQPFCYANIEGVNKATDFFTNETAKKYYKQRLRYILARWGYSTHISLFEMFSEISNVGTNEADASNFYNEGENWKLSRDWQWEMADYIKSHHNGRIHLLTGSYAGTINSKDNIYTSENLDVMAVNIYDFGAPSFSGGYWNNTVSRRLLNENPKVKESYSYKMIGNEERLVQKPIFFSEGGPVSAESPCIDNQLETNRSQWQSLFSGLAGSFSWNIWYYKKNYGEFKNINSFINGFNLLEDDWHPGASKIKRKKDVILWEYKSAYAEKMDGRFPPDLFKKSTVRTRKADIAYLRSGDKKKAIGIVTNKTYNLGSTDDCYEWEGLEKTPLSIPEDVNCKSEKLQIKGMKGGKFKIEYFNINNLKDPVNTSYQRGRSLNIEYTIKASKEDYLILFVVTKL